VRRKSCMLSAAAVVIALVAVGGAFVTSGPQQQALAAEQSSVHTAQVEKRTLSATISQPGTLTYRAHSDGSLYTVINQARGTYTKLPAPGQVIHQGHALYRVNGRPVVLLHGSTPAYRTLSVGTTGPDVAELNADLVALGYATSAQLHPTSASFGAATTTALKKLQADVGVTQSGRLTLGQAVFEPTAVRVTALSALLGGRTQPGQTVLQGTSTTRQVQMTLDASQQTEVAVGDQVTITLPDRQTTLGVVSSVGAVATCPPRSGSGGPSSSSPPPPDGTCSSGGSGDATPTITVGVSPSDPAATGKWDQAPVQVRITTDKVRNVLTVPVTALLALSGGGYAVEVVGTGASNHLVPVSLGLFDDADGLVQVAGAGLAEGQKVVVPGI
jgi:putative peptidoglycan binding protein